MYGIEEKHRFIIKLHGSTNTFCLTAYLNAKTPENNSERSKTKAEPVAPSFPTKRKFKSMADAAPIAEAYNTTLSFFNGISTCIIHTCAAPVNTITGIMICIGIIAPSYPDPANNCIIS